MPYMLSSSNKVIIIISSSISISIIIIEESEITRKCSHTLVVEWHKSFKDESWINYVGDYSYTVGESRPAKVK